MIESESVRGTGRTTRQMEGAPAGALYVWCNGHLEYPKHLARKLGRDDLKIVSPEHYKVTSRGRDVGSVVLDHAY